VRAEGSPASVAPRVNGAALTDEPRLLWYAPANPFYLRGPPVTSPGVPLSDPKSNFIWKAACLVVAAAFLLSGLLLSAQAQSPGMAGIAAPAWQVRSLDAPKWFEDMGPRNLALDAAGRPHVAYGGDHLYYAWFDGAFWQQVVVDASPGAGRYAAFSPDATGAPHFLYYDAVRNAVRYATSEGAGWRTETVQAGVTLDAALGFALDASGAAHAAYRDATTGTVTYARRAAGGWVHESVESVAGGAVDFALVESTPHLVYGTGALRHAQRDAGGWTTQTVDPAGVMLARSLAVDSGGSPQVAYTGTNGGGRAELRLARLTRTSWLVQVVDTLLPYEVGFEPSLRLDKQDYAHISYGAYNGLKYARWTGSEWFRQVADAAGGRDTSLALDAAGTLHITYRRGLELVYVRRPGLNWTFRALDTARTTGLYTALALDASGNAGDEVHISYRDAESGSLRYARQSGEAWALQVVDAAPGLPAYTAIALQDGLPRIVYYRYADVQTPGQLRYAMWTGSQWQLTTVDSDVGALDTTGPKQPALRFDAGGQPHIAYYDGGDQSVKVAVWAGDAWVADTVAGPTQTGEAISLALDRGAVPHVSFFDAQADALIYAARAGTTWDAAEVAQGAFAGRFNSLALDAADAPHLCFTQESEETSDLRYARLTAAGWQVETVDTGAPVTGSYCALALDGAGTPHVAYLDDARAVLKYAHRARDSWAITTVDAAGAVGQYATLALGAAGAPRIAYMGMTVRDLKYAALVDEPVSSPTPTSSPTVTYTPTATATPTVTHTPTPTATFSPEAERVYLPLVVR
jgi:hypothetical protein